MNANRYLVIKSLVFAVPDDFKPGKQISIDEALQLLLDYRKKASTVLHNNRDGNFVFMATDYPDSTNPEMLNFTPDRLLAFVQESPDKAFGGMMATVIYDGDLGALRNCYNATEMVEFEKRKAFILASQKQVQGAAVDAAQAMAAEQVLDSAVASKFVVNHDGEVHEVAPSDESCGDCGNICQEICPDEPGVEDKMRESEDQ